MGIRRHKAEATAIDYSKIADETAQRIHQPTVSANIWAVIGNVDGRFTTGDVFVALLLFGAFVTMGLMASVIDYATGAPWDTARSYLKDLLRWGLVVGVGYLTFEALNVVGIVAAFFEAYNNRDRNGNGKADAGPTIHMEVRLSDSEFKFLSWEGDQAKRAIEFARLYLDLATQEDYPTAEKFYVGSGKVWSRAQTGASGYPGWQAFKASLIAAELAEGKGRAWVMTDDGVSALRRLVDKARDAGL